MNQELQDQTQSTSVFQEPHSTYDVLFKLPYQHGFPVDSIMLTYWILTLDNVVKTKDESHEDFLKHLRTEKRLSNLAQKIFGNPELQEKSLQFLEHCLLSLGDLLLSKAQSESLSELDLDTLADSSDEQTNDFLEILNSIQEQYPKLPIFNLPTQIRELAPPKGNKPPGFISKTHSFRSQAKPSQISENSLHKLSKGLATASSALNSIDANDVRGLYQNLQSKYRNRFRLFSIKLQAEISNKLKQSHPEPKISTKRDTMQTVEQTSKFTTGLGLFNSQQRKVNLLRKKRQTSLHYRFTYPPSLEELDVKARNFDVNPEIDHGLIQAVFSGSAWQTNPTGVSILCKRVLMTVEDASSLELPPFEELGTLIIKASQAGEKQPVEKILESCSAVAQNLDSHQLHRLVKLATELPAMKEVLHDEFCAREASNLITSEKWDQLPKKDRINIGQLAKERHIYSVAEDKINHFLKEDTLSEIDVHRMTEITVKIMDQLVDFLAGIESIPADQGSLLAQVRSLSSEHSETLKDRIECIDHEFILECQVWLQTICQFLYQADSEYYLSVIRSIESLFVTVWKKVGEQLLKGLVV